MGTRSLTFVYENDRPIMNMYRQFDGYPSGHGLELAEFLNGKTLVNGYSDPKSTVEANGMGCLAAQMIANFKKSVGGFYIHPVEDTNCGQDYSYHVYQDRVMVLDYNRKVIYNGSWKNFEKFCKEVE